MSGVPELTEETSYELVMKALDSIGGPQNVYRNPRMAYAFNSVRNMEVEGYKIEIRYGEISTPAIATVQGWVYEILDQHIELLMKPLKRKPKLIDSIRLELLSSFPIADWGGIRAELAKLELTPDQQAFGGVPESFIELQAEPGRNVFLVYADNVIVGVGSLVTGAIPPALWPMQSRAVQLRGLAIGLEYQGQGLGTRTSLLLKDLATQLDPDAEHLTLTVNQRNPGARRTYEKAGFSTLPEPYLGGSLGPQDIMYLPLR